jgi:DNA repair exonuclease SbcCD ATPase subunit
MFKNNLYAFSALIALTCGAYAMGDELSSSEETKGGRNALRASTMSLGIDDQEPDETEANTSSPASSTPSSFFPDNDKQVTFTWPALKQAGGFENPTPDPRARALHSFLQEMFSSLMKSGVHYELPILPRQLDGNIWDLTKDLDQIRKAIEEANALSPASSIQNSLFSNDDAKATFTWDALMDAVERGEPRAKNLHGFLVEKYLHDEIKWDEKPFYKMPFLQKQLDDDQGLWAISESLEAKLAIAVGNIPTTREAIRKLSTAIGQPVNDTMTHKDREIELRIQALKAVERFKILQEKLSSTEAEYESFQALSSQELAAKAGEAEELTSQLAARETELEESRAQTAAKEEAEKQLTAQLTEREAELETSRAQTLAKTSELEELTARFAALQAEFEAFKVESQKAAEGVAAVLAAKNAHNDLLQSAISDVQATFATMAERLAALPTQPSE